MTVQDVNPQITHLGTGAQLSFPFNFRVDDVSWLSVTYITNFDAFVLNADQDISPGGVANYLVAPPLLQALTIVRTTPNVQDMDYTRYDPFDSESHEDALDKLTMEIQDLRFLTTVIGTFSPDCVTAFEEGDPTLPVPDQIDAILCFQSRDLNQYGQIGYNAPLTALCIDNDVWGSGIQMRARDNAGVQQPIFAALPDGVSNFAYHDGVLVGRTVVSTSGGLEANNLNTGAGFERVLTLSDLVVFPGGVLPAPTAQNAILAVNLAITAWEERTGYRFEDAGQSNSIATRTGRVIRLLEPTTAAIRLDTGFNTYLEHSELTAAFEIDTSLSLLRLRSGSAIEFAVQTRHYANPYSGQNFQVINTGGQWRLSSTGGAADDILIRADDGAGDVFINNLNATATLTSLTVGVGTPYTFPIADGALDEVLKTDGAGTLTFQAEAGGINPVGTTIGNTLLYDGITWVESDRFQNIEASDRFLFTDALGNQFRIVIDSVKTILNTNNAGDDLWLETNVVEMRSGAELVFRGGVNDTELLRIFNSGNVFAHIGTVEPMPINILPNNTLTWQFGTQFQTSELPIRILERASAQFSAATYGQIYVLDDAPNTLWFADDTGGLFQIGGTGGPVAFPTAAAIGDMLFASALPNTYSATSGISFDDTQRTLTITNVPGTGSSDAALDLRVGFNPSTAIEINTTLNASYTALRMNDQTGGNEFELRHIYNGSTPNHEFTLVSSGFSTIWEITNDGRMYLCGAESTSRLFIDPINDRVQIREDASLFLQEIIPQVADLVTYGQVFVSNADQGLYYKYNGVAAVRLDVPGGVTDHGALTGLVPDDDHTQYALLAGRAGGQTLLGGTLAGETLTIRGSANANRGRVLNEGGITVDWDWTTDAITTGGITSSNTIALSGGVISSFITLSNNITVNNGLFIMSALDDNKLLTWTVAAGFSVTTLFFSRSVYRSATAGIAPGQSFVLAAQNRFQVQGTGAVVTPNYRGLSYAPILHPQNAADSITVTNMDAVAVTPLWTTAAGSTANFGTIRGVHCLNPAQVIFGSSAGTETMLSYIGVDMENITLAKTGVIAAVRSNIAASGVTNFFLLNLSNAPSDFGTGGAHFDDSTPVQFGGVAFNSQDASLFWDGTALDFFFTQNSDTLAINNPNNGQILIDGAANELTFNTTAGFAMGGQLGTNGNQFGNFVAPARTVAIAGEWSDFLLTQAGNLTVNIAGMNTFAWTINAINHTLAGPGTVLTSGVLNIGGNPDQGSVNRFGIRVLSNPAGGSGVNAAIWVTAGLTQLDGDLGHTGTNLGFYGTAPIAQQAAPVTLANVITTLQNLGLTA